MREHLGMASVGITVIQLRADRESQNLAQNEEKENPPLHATEDQTDQSDSDDEYSSSSLEQSVDRFRCDDKQPLYEWLKLLKIMDKLPK